MLLKYFNSNMVRLKEMWMYNDVGPFKNFNSNMVRLKVAWYLPPSSLTSSISIPIWFD